MHTPCMPISGLPFRSLDPWGNVVAEGAEPLSICHFEVEHLFPRRRGGLTVLQVRPPQAVPYEL